MGNAIILRLWVQIRKVSVFRTKKVPSLFDTSIWDNKSVQFIEVCPQIRGTHASSLCHTEVIPVH